MYLIALINSSPREILSVILFILLILSDYGHQCALGCFHSSSYCKHFMHLSFPKALKVKRKNKHSALFFDIYIVYVSSTALCAVDSKTECTGMDKLLQFLPCHHS